MGCLMVETEPICIKTTYLLKQLDLEKATSRSLDQAGIATLDAARGRFFVFDLSGSYWHDLGALLWFVALLHRLRLQGNDLQLVFPEPDSQTGAKAWDFLIRWRFFETLALCVDDPANLLRPDQLPHLKRSPQYGSGSKGLDEFGRETILRTLRLLEIRTIFCKGRGSLGMKTEHEKLQSMDRLVAIGALSSLCGWDPNVTRMFVQRVAREGIQNSFLHAHGTFVNVSYRVDKHFLTLAISDNGQGIPQVLRDALQQGIIPSGPSRDSDVELIQYFTEPQMILDILDPTKQIPSDQPDSGFIRLSTQQGVSSRPGHAGAGLYYLKSLVLRQGGELRIRSGKACVDFIPGKTEPETQDGMLESPGTLLRIRAPLRTVCNGHQGGTDGQR